MKAYIFIFFIFSTMCSYSQNRSFNFQDTQVEVGDTCVIYPIIALNGGLPLIPESIEICDSIRYFLLNNPTVVIEIQVHTDIRPIPITNDTLALIKAKRLKMNVLKNSNIDPQRIITIAYGDQSPRMVTDEIHQQYDYLPVGQILTEEFIQTLEDRSQKEIAHSLNRRTIIKIVKNK